MARDASAPIAANAYGESARGSRRDAHSRRWRSAGAQTCSREGGEVRGDHRRPDVRGEAASTLPGATVEAERTLEEGDRALDARTKATQPTVRSPAARHFLWREPPSLAEH